MFELFVSFAGHHGTKICVIETHTIFRTGLPTYFFDFEG